MQYPCTAINKGIYVPSGKETRPGYLTNDDSYINKLSNADIHVTYNYSELLDKVKEIEEKGYDWITKQIEEK